MKITKYFIAMEDITLSIGNERVVNLSMFKKGEIGEFLEISTRNGYFKAKRLNSSDIVEIPYAPAFINFIGDDLDTVRTLYDGEGLDNELF